MRYGVQYSVGSTKIIFFQSILPIKVLSVHNIRMFKPVKSFNFPQNRILSLVLKAFTLTKLLRSLLCDSEPSNPKT